MPLTIQLSDERMSCLGSMVTAHLTVTVLEGGEEVTTETISHTVNEGHEEAREVLLRGLKRKALDVRRRAAAGRRALQRLGRLRDDLQRDLQLGQAGVTR